MTAVPSPPLWCQAHFVEFPDGSLRVRVRLDHDVHLLTITQADQLAEAIHNATQRAHESVFDYMQKYE